MKKFQRLLGLTLSIALITGCGELGNKIEKDIKQQGDPVYKEDKVEIKGEVIIDRTGNEIFIPKEINSIISLAPSVTETLIDLGLGNKIVATDSFSAYEEGLNGDIQIFDMLSPDMEAIASLQADVLIASEISMATSDDPFAMVKELGTIVTYIPTPNSIKGIREDVLFLGEFTGTDERANEIINNFDERLNYITSKIDGAYNDGVSDNVILTTYFEISPAPELYTFGEGVFLNEILGILRAENIFAYQQSWIPVTEEEVFARNPKIIFTNTYLDDSVSEIKSRNGWDAIDAVKDNRVYKVDQQASSQPNEFVILAIEEMAYALYPTVFPELAK